MPRLRHPLISLSLDNLNPIGVLAFARDAVSFSHPQYPYAAVMKAPAFYFLRAFGFLSGSSGNIASTIAHSARRSSRIVTGSIGFAPS